MWDDGDGGSVSVLHLQHIIRGGGGKIHGKIKVRKNGGGGEKRGR